MLFFFVSNVCYKLCNDHNKSISCSVTSTLKINYYGIFANWNHASSCNVRNVFQFMLCDVRRRGYAIELAPQVEEKQLLVLSLVSEVMVFVSVSTLLHHRSPSTAMRTKCATKARTWLPTAGRSEVGRSYGPVRAKCVNSTILISSAQKAPRPAHV